MMNLKSLSSVFISLALFGSLPALFGSLPANAAPTPVVPIETTASSEDERLYQMCRNKAKAVVTIYSGEEIGTGSIVSPNGLIITNYHVVQEAAQNPGKTKIYIKFKNGDRYFGQVFKPLLDQKNDLAVVKLISTVNFPEANFPDTISLAQLDEPNSSLSQQPVCAIGNPFGRTTISTGKVEGTRGSNDLRSNIHLFRGNSGGPLLDKQGKMVGVNKSIWLSKTGENTGISFSTKSVVAQRLLAEAQTYLEQHSSSIAVSAPPLSPAQTTRPVASGGVLGAIIDAKSLIIRQIVLDSPADVYGLRPGELLRVTDDHGNLLKSYTEIMAFLSRNPKRINANGVWINSR